MIKNRKQMFIIVGVFALVLMLGTVTYAFFNYTRTGTANVIKTGKISFNSTQGQAINLTNMFPIDVSSGIPNDATKVGSVTINVTGDTTYTDGIEYLVSAVNVQNTVGSGASAKQLPISIDVSVTSNTGNDPATTLGTADSDYFTNRGASANTSIYKVLAKDVIENNDQLVVGYIKSGATGVDGNIVIRAYLDASKIAISDTYDEDESGTDNMGTTLEWVGDREVFTTNEWNSLQASGVSFQIKVEANEGIWVDNSASPVLPTMDEMCPNCKYMYPEDEIEYGYYDDEDMYHLGSYVSNYEYYDDYRDVIALNNRNWPWFVGMTINNDRIDKLYLCSVKEQAPNLGTPFCIQAPPCQQGVNIEDTTIMVAEEKNRINLSNKSILETIYGQFDDETGVGCRNYPYGSGVECYGIADDVSYEATPYTIAAASYNDYTSCTSMNSNLLLCGWMG